MKKVKENKFSLDMKVEEDGNKFFRLFNRDNYLSSILYKMDISCFTRGVTYNFSGRVRLHYSEGFVGGSEKVFWYIRYRRVSDNRDYDRRIVSCAPQRVEEGWVFCEGKFGQMFRFMNSLQLLRKHEKT